MKQIPPSEFATIGLIGEYLKQDERSWRGPCPRPGCGGTRRYVVFTDNIFPLWHGYCSECGHKEKYWENYKGDKPIDTEAIRQRLESMKAQEAERENKLAAKLKEFTDHELWSELNRRMEERQRQWWRLQGIPDSIQDYLSLGWVADKYYMSGGEMRKSEAFTIPYFHNLNGSRKFVTMQYRLNDAPTNDRYRFEYNLRADYYDTNPDAPLEDQVLICEGAKKGIVSSLELFTKTVLAVPSKSSRDWFGLRELVKDCGRVYVCLDPDSDKEAQALTRYLGKNARIIRLIEKIDDAVIQFGLNQKQFESYMRQAVAV